MVALGLDEMSVEPDTINNNMQYAFFFTFAEKWMHGLAKMPPSSPI